MIFSHHIEQAANSGKVMSGWIMRTFQTRDPTATTETTCDSKLGISIPNMESNSRKRHNIARTGSKSFLQKMSQRGRSRILEKIKTNRAFLFTKTERKIPHYVWGIFRNLAPIQQKGRDQGKTLPQIRKNMGSWENCSNVPIQEKV